MPHRRHVTFDIGVYVHIQGTMSRVDSWPSSDRQVCHGTAETGCRYSQFSLHHTPAPARVIAEERVLYLRPHLGTRWREEGVAVKGSGAPIKRSIRCSYLRSYLSLSSTHAEYLCVNPRTCMRKRVHFPRDAMHARRSISENKESPIRVEHRDSSKLVATTENHFL